MCNVTVKPICELSGARHSTQRCLNERLTLADCAADGAGGGGYFKGPEGAAQWILRANLTLANCTSVVQVVEDILICLQVQPNEV